MRSPPAVLTVIAPIDGGILALALGQAHDQREAQLALDDLAQVFRADGLDDVHHGLRRDAVARQGILVRRGSPARAGR